MGERREAELEWKNTPHSLSLAFISYHRKKISNENKHFKRERTYIKLETLLTGL